jgi:CRP-like cAMP-binding protein
MRTNISILEAQPWLKGMDQRHLQLLAQDSVPAEFRPEEIIFKEGGVANRFYLIVEGSVQIESSVMEAESIPIQSLGPGDMLGCSWLFPSAHWQFDARACTLVKALCFHANHLRQLCETNHELGYELMKRVSEIIVLRMQALRRKLVEQVEHQSHA